MMETGVCRLAFRNIRRYWSVPCVGTDLARNFADALAAWLLAQHRVETPFAVPDTVDVSYREKAGEKLIFLMNFNNTAQSVRLPRACRNVLADREVADSVVIPPRDVLILSGR